MTRRFVGPRRLVPSTLRAHLTRTGNAKRQYESYEAADLDALKHHKTAYQCDVCKLWHIGGDATRRPDAAG